MSDLTKEFMQRAADQLGSRSTSRIAHGCGDGMPMVVHDGPEATKFFCFRCDARGYLPKAASVADRMDRLKWADAQRISYNSPQSETWHLGWTQMPANLWPREARLWLARYGISLDRAWNRNIRWSEKLQRVVFLLRDMNTWCARRVMPGDPGPKYLMPAGSRAYAMYQPERKFRHLQQRVVVCEDALSAVKVAEAGHYGLALLGTKLRPLALQKILELAEQATLAAPFHPTAVWMDEDAAGNSAASDIARELRMHIDVKVIRGQRSPKENHLEYIREVLK